MKEYLYIRDWVENLPKMGKSSFSLDEVKRQFPDMPQYNIINTLYRLSRAGAIKSVWRGFYTISLPEYGFSGIAPPIEYINQLMKYLGSPYYVGLLSAAAMEGASHQIPQVFQVVCQKHFRDKKAPGVRLELIEKKVIPASFLDSKTVNSGVVIISKPELTAIDLLLYPNRVGGISNVATVLSELAENLKFDFVDSNFFTKLPAAPVQRLGFILEDVLEEKDTAEKLYARAMEAGIGFRRISLTANPAKLEHTDFPFNSKWKVEINDNVEPDI